MSEKKGSGRTRSKERDVCRSERGENVGIGEGGGGSSRIVPALRPGF